MFMWRSAGSTVGDATKGCGGSRLSLVLCVALASLAGCAQGRLGEEHPLRDVIVDPASGNPVSRERLVDEMSAATVVYLGEKHDNAEHHRHQLWILGALVDGGRRPLLGLEVFSVDQTPLLMEYVMGKPSHGAARTPEETLRAALGWGSSRDESWGRYGPLLRLARQHGLTVFGIDLPVALRRRISRVGIEGLTPVEREQVPEAGPTAPSYRAFMLESLKQSHCGYGSESYLAKLFANWQARNETMAQTIVTAVSGRDDSPVLVVLGGAHVRHGQGVVPRVRSRLPDARQLNLGFREVDPEHLDLGAYLSTIDHQGQLLPPSHDRLWLTARDGLTAEAACARFGKILKKHG